MSEDKKLTESEKRLVLLEEDLQKVRLKLTKKETFLSLVMKLSTSALTFVLILLFASFLYGKSFKELFNDIEIISLNIIISVFVAIMLLVTPSYIKLFLKIRERFLMGEIAMLGSEKLQDKIEEDFFTNLVKINFKYIDKYYLQTQIQADKSFSVSVICSIIAFLVIISGIILMYFNKTNSAYIATGAGVMSQFIGAVFFYLYNKTIIKMGEYHHKLVLTQNISLALKITEQMPETEKVISQSKLIEELTKDINKLIGS